MTKIEIIKSNWTEIIDRLRSDKQELAQFLRFSARMYKQSFSDAALIYHQNPNATKVATLETRRFYVKTRDHPRKGEYYAFL